MKANPTSRGNAPPARFQTEFYGARPASHFVSASDIRRCRTAPREGMFAVHRDGAGAANLYALNLLLTGSRERTNAVVAAMERYLSPPVLWWPRQAAPWCHDRPLRTLVLDGVEALDDRHQDGLHHWLQGVGREVRVVSTTDTDLFPLVARGAFCAALYYRLNTVRLECGTASDGACAS